MLITLKRIIKMQAMNSLLGKDITILLLLTDSLAQRHDILESYKRIHEFEFDVHDETIIMVCQKHVKDELNN